MKKEQGFTLLEMIITILLFSMFLSAFTLFFGTVYRNYTKFQTQVKLANEERIISEFIRDEIRLAEQITIKVKPANLPALDIYWDKALPTADITEATLMEINIREKGKVATIKLEGLPVTAGAKYKLSYRSNGTTMVISEIIENLTISQKKQSDILSFTCVVGEKASTSEKLTSRFEEVLTYKKPY